MNLRSIRRAARVALAAGIFATSLGVASAASADVCSPQPKPTLTMTVSKGYFYEHEKTIVWFKLSNPSCTEVSWDVSTKGLSATEGVDFTDLNLSITFPPGATSHGWAIWGINDSLQEGVEWFSVTIANPSGATLLGTTTKYIAIDGTEPQ